MCIGPYCFTLSGRSRGAVAHTGRHMSPTTAIWFQKEQFHMRLLCIAGGTSFDRCKILYYLSSWYGQIIVLNFGKYIHFDGKKLTTVEEKFRKYGAWVIIFRRHISGFRIPIMVFSGMSGVSYKTFIVSTFISVIFWILFYLSVGQQFGAKIVRLLHGHNGYFVLLLIPFLIFIGSILKVVYFS